MLRSFKKKKRQKQKQKQTSKNFDFNRIICLNHAIRIIFLIDPGREISWTETGPHLKLRKKMRPRYLPLDRRSFYRQLQQPYFVCFVFVCLFVVVFLNMIQFNKSKARAWSYYIENYFFPSSLTTYVTHKNWVDFRIEWEKGLWWMYSDLSLIFVHVCTAFRVILV